ncbi:TIM-barrel domain-containing protein [Marinimicrobium agarilyticum]|uniref:TIM-barrel domain-containing protein n=1 Tax=Marinimicrobium agarilyticum TaxID=306546 RepID=UPI00042665EB|nr:TIM-barrel domain-containing protein [Marinimicrobium agarilyticum]
MHHLRQHGLGLWLLALLLLGACATQGPTSDQNHWQSGDYRLSLGERGLDIEYRGEVFATIDSFEFNFVKGTITELVKPSGSSDGQARLDVVLEGEDGYTHDFPERLRVMVTQENGRFHFEASHPGFHHIGINLVDRDEHYFGLLEKLYPDNRKSPDLRGETVTVDVYHQGERDYAENYASAFSAFYISSAGYGSFFDTFAKGEYRFAQSGLTHVYHQTDALDWYLIHGPTGQRIHRRYYEVIGEPKSVPLWALGPVVWRDYNTGKAEILSDLEHFSALRIPLTATFVDRPYSDGGHEWSKMNFTEAFADPEEWIGTINRDYGMEVMSWVGPMTFGDTDFPGLLPNHRTYIDLTDPEALVEFERRLQTLQYDVGIRGHKMDRADENFPMTALWHEPVPESQTRNTYVYLYSKVIDQFLRGAHGDNQFNFARAAYHRTQPFLSAVWGGDVRPNWQGMAGNLANAMRVGFMGFPVWGSDTGGYLGDGRIDEKLYARWLQWGAWNGMFEIKLDGIGGQGEDRVPWHYSERLQAVFREAAEQRMAMIPYSYSLANTSASNGVLMKPMAYVYPNDEHTYDLWDQYLFGEAFLVAPMLSPDDQRSVYLPAGHWYDFYDLTRAFDGKRTLSVTAEFDRIPVFVRGNSLYVTGDIYRGSDRRWRGPLEQGRLILHALPGRPGQDTVFTYVDALDGDREKRMTLTRSVNEVTLQTPALTVPSVVRLRLDQAPAQVWLNGARTEATYDAERKILALPLSAGQDIELRVTL